jgi:DNA-binding CsgD family transcriptional regulator
VAGRDRRGRLARRQRAADGRLRRGRAAVPAGAGATPPQLADTIRLRSRGGQWLSLHASRLGGRPAPQIGIVIEPTPAAQVSSLLLSAYGLTGAQSRVVALVIRGHSTRQIVEELHISANTVQEHLTAAFDKFGVRSRRELVAAMLTGRPG